MSAKDLYISWEEFHRYSKALAWQLGEKGPWKGIIAVTRGGLVPAALIASELGIKHVETVCISSYDHKSQRGAEIIKPIEPGKGSGAGWLVIDDLVDTGNTARIIREELPEAHLAAVYVKPASMKLVDTFMTMVSQDTWIHFPWEPSNLLYSLTAKA